MGQYNRTRILAAFVTFTLLGSIGMALGTTESTSSPTTHSPIVIVGNSGFTVENGIVGGSGTLADPYIIEGWEIVTSTQTGISISTTNAYLVIQNVVLNGGGGLSDGILLSGCSNVVISQCIVSNFGNGVHLVSTENIVISGNQVSSSRSDGILVLSSSFVRILQNDLGANGGAPAHEWPCAISIQWPTYSPGTQSDNITIGANTIHDNLGSAIGIGTYYPPDTFDILLASNTVSDNTDGIWTFGTKRLTVCGNHIESTPYAVYLEYTEGARVSGNNFVNCLEPGYDDRGPNNLWNDSYPSGGNYWSSYSGVDLKSGPYQNLPGSDGFGDTPYVIDSDSRDRYPRMQPCTIELAYIPHAPIRILSNADLTPQNGVTGGSGTQSDPYVIEGWIIDVMNQTAIQIGGVDANLLVRGVRVIGGSGLSTGIRLSDCSNIVVSQCIISDFGVGINPIRAKNVLLTQNQISASRSDGVLVISSTLVRVLRNDIYSNGWAPSHEWPCGVSIQWPGSISVVPSDNITVGANNIHDNLGSAIGVGTNYPSDTFDILIASNTIVDNVDGIWIFGTKRITICGNHIENTPYAVYLEYTEGARVSGNNFVGCTEPGYDDRAAQNRWNDYYPSGGNYWSNYAGVDLKSGPNQDQPGSDGIGDTPYVIDLDSQDRYPLMQPCIGQPTYVPHMPIHIAGNGDLTAQNGVTGGSGTESDPYVIEGWIIDAMNQTAMDVRNVDLYLVIRNVLMVGGSGYSTGIFLRDCRHVIVSQCIVSDFGEGIRLYGDGEVVVSENQVSSCRSEGILVLASSWVRVLGNDLYANGWAPFHAWPCAVAIQYPGSTMIPASDHVTVGGNNIHDNLGSAMGVGYYESDTFDILIVSNTVTGNADGIWTWGTRRIAILGNYIEATPYAVYLEYTDNATIWANNFVNDLVPGYDNRGIENLWNDIYPIGGNYWSDYAGVDLMSGPNQDQPGSDGIGDTPYVIDADSRDRYPLMTPSGFNSPPVAQFTIDREVGLPMASFKFDASSSWDLQDAPSLLSVRWDWEADGAWDTAWSTEKLAEHSYAQSGAYTVRLEVLDTGGLTDTYDGPTIFVGNIAPVIAGFSASTLAPKTEQIVTFDATVHDWNGDLCSLTFDFGDGTTVEVVQTVANSTVSASHAYSTAGPVQVYVTASDGEAPPVLSSPILLNVVWESFVLHLLRGWNLVSIPLVGYGYNSGNLGLSPGDVVVGWNSSRQLYDRVYLVGIHDPSAAFTIEQDEGFWIYSMTSKDLTLFGSVPTTTQYRDCDVPTGGGWVLVGFSSLNSTRHASDIPGMYSVPGGVMVVVTYNTLLGTYRSYIRNIPSTDFPLVVGQGYWIWCSADGVLTYTP